MAVKQTIRHKDPDGNKVESDWYFSLGRSDLLEMNLVHEHDDVTAYISQLMKDPKGNSREILDMWKEMLFRSVGKREGQLLVKGPEVEREFRFSGAYEEFLSNLLDKEDAGSSFFVSIMPEDVQAKIAEDETRQYSETELLGMSDEEFARIAGSKKNMSKEHLLIRMKRQQMKRNNKASSNVA